MRHAKKRELFKKCVFYANGPILLLYLYDLVMESKLLRIELQPSSRATLNSLINFMVENPINPKTEMAQKGYFWDSVFFEEVNDQNFIYIVVKSEDFSSIMLNENNLVHTPFREIYEKFQRDAWIPETYTDIEEIFCFNESMVFIT